MEKKPPIRTNQSGKQPAKRLRSLDAEALRKVSGGDGFDDGPDWPEVRFDDSAPPMGPATRPE